MEEVKKDSIGQVFSFLKEKGYVLTKISNLEKSPVQILVFKCWQHSPYGLEEVLNKLENVEVLEWKSPEITVLINKQINQVL